MDTDKTTKRPLLISHRGAHQEAPENSAPGFEIAIGYGVDGIETDVQLTRDGVPVLHHNVTASTITGRRKPVSSYTCAELKAFDLGRGGTRAKILTLTETFEQFSRRTALLIEIKSRKSDRRAGRHLVLSDKVVAQINKLPAAVRKTIRVLSFDPDVLVRVNRIAPQLKCVLNADGSGSWCVGNQDLMVNRVSLDFLSAVCLEKKKLSAQFLAWAHARGMEVFTYCCNTRPQVARALALGVDGIMSDKPGWLVRIVRG